MKYGYATERRSETWTAIVGISYDDAVERAGAEVDPDCPSVFICEQVPLDREDLACLVIPHAEELLIDAEERRGDNEVAPWWEDNLFDDSPASIGWLEDRLRDAVGAWLTIYPPADTWTVANVVEYRRIGDEEPYTWERQP